MLTALMVGAVWTAVALGAGVLIGRGIRHADEMTRRPARSLGSASVRIVATPSRRWWR